MQLFYTRKKDTQNVKGRDEIPEKSIYVKINLQKI